MDNAAKELEMKKKISSKNRFEMIDDSESQSD